MRSKILLFIPLLLLSFTLKAQETETVVEEPEETGATLKRYKYEIGLDLKWIFGNSSNYYFSNNLYYDSYFFHNNGLKLFGRVHKSKLIPGSVMSRKYAYRFGVKINVNLLLSDNETQINSPYQYYATQNNAFSVLAESGYEVQKQFKKFQLYYGADVGISYSSYFVSEYQQDANNRNIYNKVSEIQRKSIGVALSPLVGMKYFLHSRMSVSLESKINIGLFSSSEEETMKELTSKRVGLNLWTDPVHAINVSYYFDL